MSASGTPSHDRPDGAIDGERGGGSDHGGGSYPTARRLTCAKNALLSSRVPPMMLDFMTANLLTPQPPAIDTLIEQCLDGDQAAWEQIVRQHWRKVFNVAYKFVGSHEQAEDLTQDIFLKIFRSLDTFDRRANFQTWLISVSRNLCIDHYRSVRKERQTIDRDVPAEDLSPVSRHGQPAGDAREPRPRRAAPPGAADAAGVAPHRGAAARHPGTVVSRDRRAAAPARRHGQVAHQPRAGSELARQILRLREEADERPGAMRAGRPDGRIRSARMNLTITRTPATSPSSAWARRG